MGRFLVVATVAAALCVTALLAVSAAAAVNCGGGVTVKGGTACWKARSIVKEFKRRQKTHVQGFDCSGSKSGGRWTEVTCTLQGKRIHWEP
jgi:hypothetical protein